MAYVNRCIVCGRNFTARQSNYTICSDQCRKDRWRELYETNKEDPEFRERRRLRALKSRRTLHKRYCQICGEEIYKSLDPNVKLTVTRLHESCVVKRTMDLIIANHSLTSTEQNRLYYKGWTVKEVKELIPDYLSGNLDESIFADDRVKQGNENQH